MEIDNEHRLSNVTYGSAATYHQSTMNQRFYWSLETTAVYRYENTTVSLPPLAAPHYIWQVLAEYSAFESMLKTLLSYRIVRYKSVLSVQCTVQCA